MTIVQPDRLAAYLDDEAAAATDRAYLLIDLADAAILPLIAGANPPLDQDFRVEAIALEVVARAIRNPGGYIDESLDDWRGRLPEATARAGVYLTDDEKQTLLALAAPDDGRGRIVRSVKLVSDSTAPSAHRLPTP